MKINTSNNNNGNKLQIMKQQFTNLNNKKYKIVTIIARNMNNSNNNNGNNIQIINNSNINKNSNNNNLQF